MNTRLRLLCNKSSTAHHPESRFKTALSYVTFLYSEWRIETNFYLSFSCLDVLNHNGSAFRKSPTAFWGYVHNLPDWFSVRFGNRSDAMWIMLWKIKLYRTGPELNCSHRTRSICSIFVSIWQKKPSLDFKRVITRFHSKSNRLNSPFTSEAERSEKLSDMEHVTFGIGAFQIIVTKIVPDQLDHMLTERPPIGFQKHSDNRSGMVLPPPPPPPHPPLLQYNCLTLCYQRQSAYVQTIPN